MESDRAGRRFWAGAGWWSGTGRKAEGMNLMEGAGAEFESGRLLLRWI